MMRGVRHASFAVAIAVALVAGGLAQPALAAPSRSRVGGLSGTVVGRTGTPLAGATVTAYALPGAKAGCVESDDLWAPVATTTTGSGGTYTLPVGPGAYRVGVTPRDLTTDSRGYFVASTQADGSNVTGWVAYGDDVTVGTALRSGVNVRLTTPVAITGRVTRGSFGGPGVGGFEVRAVQSQGWGGQMQRIAPTTLTGATGDYAITGLPSVVPDPRPLTPINEAALYGVVGRDPAATVGGFIWWQTVLDGVPPADRNYLPDVDVSQGPAVRSAWVSPVGRITGTVTDAKGRPLAGIAVDPPFAFPMPPVLTDKKGRYSLPAWSDEFGNPTPTPLRYTDPTGAYRTSWSGGVATLHDAVPVPPTPVGTTTVANLRLLDGAASVSGLVWYAAGVPAAGAGVAAWVPGHVNDWEWNAPQAAAACDGTFTVGGLWPGSYTMAFAPPNEENAPVTVPVNLVAGQRLGLPTVTLPSWIVTGQVRSPGGQPLSGVRVDLWTDDEGGIVQVGSRGASATTDGNGFFRVFSVRQGGLRVGFTDPTGTYPLEFWQDQPDVQSATQVTDDDPYDGNGVWLDVRLGTP